MTGSSPTSSNALTEFSATELAQQIGSRHVSATEVVRAFLSRIEQTNPRLNAICTVDADGALAAASEIDRRLRHGVAARRLEGVPFVAKDNLETRGVRTTYGALPHAQHVPDEDAICVERLRAAGAVLIGKTNTPEFASDVNTTNRLFGPTRNPWDPRVSPAGSSGGTGSALAAAMAPLGLGTDLGGSVRLPAAFCGVIGLRTVPGRVPVYPAAFAWDTLVEHVHGPLATTVADVGLMLSVLAGPDDRAPNSLPLQGCDYVRAAAGDVPISGRRFAYSANLGGIAPVDPEVAALTQCAARQLERLGATVEEAFPDLSDLKTIVAGTRAFGIVGRFADYVDAHREQATEQLQRQVADSLRFDLKGVAAAERLRTAYYHRIRQFQQRYDYLVCPTAGVPPFRLDEPLPTHVGGEPIERFYDVFLYTYAFSVTGLPSISVPCGFTRSGLPVGLQIVGRRLREDSVLEAAAALLRACPEYLRRPRLDAQALSRFEPLRSPVSTSADWIGGPR
ncbi:MAG TPA: amidase [Burkholderiaceae bacterium]|nr:amidase [Burkholderiaceae bacterium]